MPQLIAAQLHPGHSRACQASLMWTALESLHVAATDAFDLLDLFTAD